MRRLSIDGSSSSKLSRPIEATIWAALATVARWKLATRSILSGTYSARASPGSWVATPVGQWLVLHFIAWMQPTANIIARADSVKSAPWKMRLTMSTPLATLPDAPILMCSRSPVPDQAVVHQHQALGQRHADVVLEFLWGRAGTALGTVDDDEVRGDAGLQHGLADGQELGAGADAELEPDRLTAGQAAQRRDEVHHLQRRGERGVRRRGDDRLADRHPAGRGDLGG